MKNKKLLVMAIIIALAIALTGWLSHPKAVAEVAQDNKPVLSPAELDLIHRQEVWISALEWHESKGRNSALNPKDRDGTPSYSNFQWKPSTFINYGKKYGLIPKEKTVADFPELVKDYELQRNIVRNMIKDPDVKWYNEFPDVTKNKIGLPPKK